MAITRGSTSLHSWTTASTSESQDHTGNSTTTILILSIYLPADIDLTVEPTFNTSESFTLIDETTSSGTAGDIHVLTYGLMNPTDTTAPIAYSHDSSTYGAHFAVNYSGTETASVAAATNFLSEDVNDAAAETNTNVHASAGTSGATLYVAVGGQGGDMWTGSVDNSFSEIRDSRTGTNTNFDLHYYAADKIAGAPSAVTVTHSQTDSNAGHLIEILLPAGGNAPTGNISGPLSGPLAGVI